MSEGTKEYGVSSVIAKPLPFSKPRKKWSLADPKLLKFNHRKLPKRAKEYRSELSELTYYLLDNNLRLQRSANNWMWITKEMSNKRKDHLRLEDEFESAFVDLIYHLENLLFRIYAYRDKLCQFTNSALDLGYDEHRINPEIILSHNKVKTSRLNLEIKRFKKRPLKDFIEMRNKLTHKLWSADNTFAAFLPDMEYADFRKELREWGKSIKPIAVVADKVVSRVLEMNGRIVGKILIYYARMKD